MSDSKQQSLQQQLAELKEQNNALQAQNAMLRTVLDHLPVGITLNDPKADDHPVIYVNKTFTDITGYPAEEVLGRNSRFLQGEETEQEHIQEMWDTQKRQEANVFLLRNYRKDGTPFWNRFTLIPLITDGQIERYIGIQADVTDQVTAQHALTQQEQRIRVLYEISTRSDLTLAQQLTLLLKVGSEQLGLNNGILSQVEDGTYLVKHVYAPNTPLAVGQTFPLGNTYCSVTLQADQVIAIHHAEQSEYQGHPCHNLFELEAYIGVPLIVNNKRYGTLNFSDALPHQTFSPSDLDFVRLMGQWASSTIEREQAQTQLKERLEEITVLNELMRLLTNINQLEPIMQTVVDKVGRLFKAKHTSLALIMGDQAQIEVMADYTRFDSNQEFDAKENIIGLQFAIADTQNLQRAIQTKQPVILTDAQENPQIPELHDFMKTRGTQCLMILPMLARGEVIAIMGIDLDQKGRVFTREETRSAETIAGQIAGAIDNARLYKAAQNEIAEHKRTEQALQEARDDALEANRLKDQFLAKVSHELRTPLGAIVGYAELLEEGVYGEVTARQARTLGEMIGSANYLTSLVNELLDIAKLESGEISLDRHTFQVLDLFRSVRSQMKILADNKGLTLEIDLHESLPPHLMGDVHRLRQILVNLVGNAIKFTEQGDVLISAYRPNQTQWAFAVKDTGIGIPQDAQAYVFEAFRQVNNSAASKFKGTGLGLAIVKQLVDLMEGEITLESQQGVGTTFTVILPLYMI